MTNLFKNLFKPASRRSQPSTPQYSLPPTLTPSEVDMPASPVGAPETTSSGGNGHDEDVNDLARRLLRRIESESSNDRNQTMRSLLEVLRGTNLGEEEASHPGKYRWGPDDRMGEQVQVYDNDQVITPFHMEPKQASAPSNRTSSSYLGDMGLGDSELSRSERTIFLPETVSRSSRRSRRSDTSAVPVGQDTWARVEGEKVIEACSAAQTMAAKLLKTLDPQEPRGVQLIERCLALLEAQRRELEDILVYLDKGQYAALRTLGQIYGKLATGLEDANRMKASSAIQTITTLVHVLEEGPDYLTDTLILELITHHAESIDPNLGFQIRNVLNQAIAAQSDLMTFRQAAGEVIALAVAVPEEVLDDELARAAYRIIGLLVKQLKLRVDTQQPGTLSPDSSSLPSSPASFGPTPIPGSLTPVTGSATPTPGYATYNATDLTKDFGTGPIATPNRSLPPSVNASNIGTPSDPMSGSARGTPLSKPTQPTAPASPDSPASNASSGSGSGSDISIFEYDGHFLTHSALNLVLAQEAQAMADSSGQYRGEVSWDDVRNAWVPKYAVKLKPTDLAEGEIPSTNPADFELKEEDEWGNKIGWRDDGRMYYLEDPTFGLKES